MFRGIGDNDASSCVCWIEYFTACELDRSKYWKQRYHLYELLVFRLEDTKNIVYVDSLKDSLSSDEFENKESRGVGEMPCTC